MRKLKFYSIRSRIILFSLSMILLLLLGRSAYIIQTHISNINNQIQEDLTLNLSLGESALRSALWDLNLENMDDVLDMFLSNPNIQRVEVTDENNAVLIAKEKATARPSENAVKGSRQITHQNHNIGFIHIHMTTDLYYMSLYREILEELLFTLLEMLLFSIMLWVASSRITKPIEKLIQIADHIAKGDLDAEFGQVSNDEIGTLGKSLETMQSQIREHISALEEDRSEISALYEETTAMNEELASMLDRVNASYEDTIKALANAIEASDEYTKGHCDRVEKYALMVAAELGLGPSESQALSKAAILHDIGKIGVPTDILNKETPLTDAEFALIKQHSLIGYQILKGVDFLQDSILIILQHHERYDGLGYPHGISGEAILRSARIISIADAFDAMTTSRAYRKVPYSREKALAELTAGSGRQFDPELVDVFKRCLSHEAN